MATPPKVVAKPIHAESKQASKRALWARLCYFYPQYSLKEASELSVRDIRLLLKTAERIEAERMFNLVQIAAAPHTKKGQGVKNLSDQFRRLMTN